MNHYHIAFGWTLDADIALPELPSSGLNTLRRRIVIRQGAPAASSGSPEQSWVDSEGREWMKLTSLGSNYHMLFEGLAAFLIVPDQLRIEYRSQSAGDEQLRHLLVDQVLPLLVSYLGSVVLHASAIRLDCDAVLFVGTSGRGKSTIAAALCDRASDLLADDGVAVDGGPPTVMAIPGYRGLRLWPETLRKLEIGAHGEFLASCRVPKVRLSPVHNFGAGDEMMIPLRRIYLLGGTSEKIRVQSIAAQSAMRSLWQSSFLLGVRNQDRLAQYFRQLSGVVTGGYCRSLEYPRRFDCLRDVRRAVLSDIYAR